jgi:hypothetical protein
MSVAIDIFERMFEYEEMLPASSASPLVALATRKDVQKSAVPKPTVQELQSRIASMQATKLDARTIPTHPAIAGLLPGGGLQEGSVYSVAGSGTLLMALLAEPSRAGTWCGVIGVPEFGVEAAQRFGVDLERLVLVPEPGDQWLAVTAAIADALGVIVMRPPKRASDGAITRLAARLRQRGSTLIVLGTWPQSEAMLTLTESDWSGIGDGHGHLEARKATITVTSRLSGRPRSTRLWLPDLREEFTRVEPERVRREPERIHREPDYGPLYAEATG